MGVNAEVFYLCLSLETNVATESEIEELKPELEAKVCGLDVDALGQLAEHLVLEKEKLGRLQLSKQVREKIE